MTSQRMEVNPMTDQEFQLLNAILYSLDCMIAPQLKTSEGKSMLFELKINVTLQFEAASQEGKTKDIPVSEARMEAVRIIANERMKFSSRNFDSHVVENYSLIDRIKNFFDLMKDRKVIQEYEAALKAVPKFKGAQYEFTQEFIDDPESFLH